MRGRGGGVRLLFNSVRPLIEVHIHKKKTPRQERIPHTKNAQPAGDTTNVHKQASPIHKQTNAPNDQKHKVGQEEHHIHLNRPRAHFHRRNTIKSNKRILKLNLNEKKKKKTAHFQQPLFPFNLTSILTNNVP